jgi:hypothetical protein
MTESLKKSGNLELMKDLLADKSMPAMPDPTALMGEGDREQQLSNFRSAALARVRDAAGLVARKGTGEEAAAFREMLMNVADSAANAAKEGGFLGIGGERVSAEEKSFLDEVKSVLKPAA